MSTVEQRQQMAAAIVDFEARRDAQGHLKIYRLPPEDGGGRYEVAGINEKYNKDTADVLVRLIEQERFTEAEGIAVDFIAEDTDRAQSWTGIPAIEFYLRDSVFNRGGRGGARILQRALGIEDDGVIGAKTRAAMERAESDGEALLRALRGAREAYEDAVAGARPIFRRGLVNRWNKAMDIAKRFPMSRSAPVTQAPGPITPVPIVPPVEPSIPSPLPLAPEPQAGPATISALRTGMRGPRVAAWQAFLLGQGFGGGPTDGYFGEHTRDATKEFQRKYRLEDDGVAGRETLLKAASLGFELIEEPTNDNTSSNFPPRPSFNPLVSNAQRAAIFGRFDYVSAPTPDNPEAIRILGRWEEDNIVRVPLPQLRKALGSRAPEVMRFHRLAAAQLTILWAEWEKAKLLDRVLSYDGAFVPRFIRGSRSTLSNHAFGSAFDINYRWNKLGERPALVGEKGSVRELVQIANRCGFYWGGHFSGRPDGMHFEVAFIA